MQTIKRRQRLLNKLAKWFFADDNKEAAAMRSEADRQVRVGVPLIYIDLETEDQLRAVLRGEESIRRFAVATTCQAFLRFGDHGADTISRVLAAMKSRRLCYALSVGSINDGVDMIVQYRQVSARDNAIAATSCSIARHRYGVGVNATAAASFSISSSTSTSSTTVTLSGLSAADVSSVLNTFL